jgi:hypothetical protein
MIPLASRQSLGLCSKLCSVRPAPLGATTGTNHGRYRPMKCARIPHIVDHSVHAIVNHASPPGDPIPPPTSRPLLGGPPDWTVQRGQRESRRPGRFQNVRVVRVDAQLTARRKSIGSSRIVIRTAWSMFITSAPTSRSRCGFDDTSSASDVDSGSNTVMDNGKVLDQLLGTDGPTCGVTLDARGDLSVIPASRSVRKVPLFACLGRRG